jgi:hypothetical protein
MPRRRRPPPHRRSAKGHVRIEVRVGRLPQVDVADERVSCHLDRRGLDGRRERTTDAAPQAATPRFLVHAEQHEDRKEASHRNGRESDRLTSYAAGMPAREIKSPASAAHGGVG